MGKKGAGSPLYLGLSVLGIAIGLFLFFMGKSGKTIPAAMIMVIGLFVIAKEIMDIFH